MSRNLSFDVVKGLAILLVVFAHFASHWQIENVIFSFHMPLFILLAGLFEKREVCIRDFGKRTWQNVWRLLFPYFGTLLYMCIVSYIWDVCTGAASINLLPFVRLGVSTGDFYATPYGEAWCGPLWFLFALFITRELFFLLRCFIKNPYAIVVICAALSYVSSLLYPLAAPMAWNPLPGIGMLVFYAIGWFAHQKHIPSIAKITGIIAWLIVLYWYLWGGATSHLDMRTCHANLLEVLGACGGSLVIYGFCQYLLSALEEVQQWCSRRGWKFTPAPFWTWCGRNSMLILCIHSFDLVTNKFMFVMNSLMAWSPWIASLDSAWLAVIRAALTLLVALLIDLGLHLFYYLRDSLFPNTLEHVPQSIN